MDRFRRDARRRCAGASVTEFLRYRGPEAVFVVNCNPEPVLKLAAASLLWFWRSPLFAVDLVMRRPSGMLGRMALPFRRFLFTRVDPLTVVRPAC